MKRHLSVIPVLLILCMAAAGGLPAQAEQSDASKCSLVCLTQEDDGGTVHVRRGEFIHLLLRSNPSTGYDWHLSEVDPEVVLDLSHSFVPDSDLWGSPGKVHWFFQAVGKGETALLLHYYRLSEGPGSATDSFQVRVVVH